MEKNIKIEDGLSDVSYSAVVDSYFEVDQLSENLRGEYEQHKELVKKEHITGED